jgi:hypothetical protein
LCVWTNIIARHYSYGAAFASTLQFTPTSVQHRRDILPTIQESAEAVMQQPVPHSTHNLGAIGQPIPEKINLPFVSHPGRSYPVTSGSIPKNVALGVSNKKRSFMSKLSDAFFNYLRNRCL